MGTFALWGAIGGAAKGAEKGLLMKAEDESYEKRAKIDEARERRLEELRQKGRMDVQSAADKAAMERLGEQGQQSLEEIGARGEEARTTQEAGHEQAMELEGERAFNQEQLQVIEQNWKSIENELDRLNRLDVADRQRAASGSSNPLVKAYIDRYEKSQLTEQQMNEYGIPMSQRDLPLTYDKMDGKYYAQEGDKLYLANAERPDLSKYESPGQEHLEALAADPIRYELQFINSFGYLPGWFLGAKMSAGLQQVSGTASE